MNPHKEPVGPRPRTWMLLGAGVLAAHAALLAPVTGTTAWAAAPMAAPSHAPARTEPVAPTAVPRPAAVEVTQVQWNAVPTPSPKVKATRVEKPAPAPAPAQAITSRQTDHTTDSPATDASTPAAPDTELIAQAATPAPTAGTSSAPAAAPRSDPPPATELNYDVFGQAKGFDYRATGLLSWRREGPNYEARLELAMPLLGKRVQTSQGSVGPDGLRPVRFADKRSSERAAHFEPEARRIRFSNNAPEAEWMPGAQDRLSLFMQLAGLMRAQPRQTGEVLSFQVAGVGDAEVWRFEVGALETLRLPAGNIEARLLKRTPRKAHDSTVEVWLAPSLGHLPVRLRIAQSNGDVADQRLSRMP
jgi:hypothetical protein